ncbi:uncharacterized protein K441DRAFT_582483, partial [Cenococcum geophilum 1.58]|uniref:uncharacterized protein n=1 Tax=Cenococcum geophilum 1.58 TaxID=794803 RepID=UPI00358F62FD
AVRREIKRKEDAAYSLLGIFNIYILPIYREGRGKAFIWLRKGIKESLRDELYTLPLVLFTEQLKRKHEPFLIVFFSTNPNFIEVSSYKKHYNNKGKV